MLRLRTKKEPRDEPAAQSFGRKRPKGQQRRKALPSKSVTETAAAQQEILHRNINLKQQRR
jgi:hypothetical protein